YWVSWATDKTVEAPLRSRLLLAAWLRSKLLGRASGLDAALVQTYPSMKKQMGQYTAAPAGAEKDFALACLILDNYGMSPYLQDSLQRHMDKIDEWDTFNDNFWLPTEPAASTAKSPKPKDPLDTLSRPHGNFLGAKRVSQMLDSYSRAALPAVLSADEK